MIYYGVDPGITGAIARYDTVTRDLFLHDMPVSPGAKGKTELLHGALYEMLLGNLTEVWVEQVGAMPSIPAGPGQPRRSMGATSAFNFGQNVGAIHMAVAAAGHSLRLVTPKTWKGHFRLVKDKGAARGLAAQRFPQHASLFTRVKDAGRAEAALIALYGAEIAGS